MYRSVKTAEKPVASSDSINFSLLCPISLIDCRSLSHRLLELSPLSAAVKQHTKMDHVTLAWAVVGNVFLIFATMRRILVIGETFNFQVLLNIHFANFMSFLASAWYGMPWITYDNLLFAMMNISCAALEISYLIKAYQEKPMYRRELLHTAKTVFTVLAMFIMGCYLIFDDYYLTKLSAVLAAALAGAVSLIPSKDTMQNCFMGVSSTAWMVYAQRRNDRYMFWPNLVGFLSAAFQLLDT